MWIGIYTKIPRKTDRYGVDSHTFGLYLNAPVTLRVYKPGRFLGPSDLVWLKRWFDKIEPISVEDCTHCDRTACQSNECWLYAGQVESNCYHGIHGSFSQHLNCPGKMYDGVPCLCPCHKLRQPVQKVCTCPNPFFATCGIGHEPGCPCA